MKKTKIALWVIGVVVLLIAIDSICSLVLNTNPLFSIKEYYNGGTLNFIAKGIVVDTYNCTDGVRHAGIKGDKYACTQIESFVIVDTSKDIEDFACAEALEGIYTSGIYTYYLPCIKSSYIEVRYSNGMVENIKEALESGNISVEDLDTFGIKYYKYTNFWGVIWKKEFA